MGTASHFIKTGGKRIPCAISRSALQSLSGHPYLATSDLLGRFMDSRGKIEEIAARIFHITPEWFLARSAYGPAISTIRRRLMHFALHELVPFTIDDAAAAGSRAFQSRPKVDPAGHCNNRDPTSNPPWVVASANPRPVLLRNSSGIAVAEDDARGAALRQERDQPTRRFTVAHLSGVLKKSRAIWSLVLTGNISSPLSLFQP